MNSANTSAQLTANYFRSASTRNYHIRLRDTVVADINAIAQRHGVGKNVVVDAALSIVDLAEVSNLVAMRIAGDGQ